jgi:hypothetical protein
MTINNEMAPGRFDLAMVTDLADGSQLKAARRVILTPTEAIFPEDMTRENSAAFLQCLQRIELRAQIYRADALKFVQRKFGVEALNEIVGQLELDFYDTEEASLVALIEPEHRHVQLSAKHYIAAGSLMSAGTLAADRVASWMTVSVEEQLTPEELKESILAGRVVKHTRSPGAGGTTNRTAFLSIHAIGALFTRWLKQMESRGFPMDKIALEQKREIFEELRPIGEVWERLRAELFDSVGLQCRAGTGPTENVPQGTAPATEIRTQRL